MKREGRAPRYTLLLRLLPFRPQVVYERTDIVVQFYGWWLMTDSRAQADWDM
jgi:hypothetical protein